MARADRKNLFRSGRTHAPFDHKGYAACAVHIRTGTNSDCQYIRGQCLNSFQHSNRATSAPEQRMPWRSKIREKWRVSDTAKPYRPNLRVPYMYFIAPQHKRFARIRLRDRKKSGRSNTLPPCFAKTRSTTRPKPISALRPGPSAPPSAEFEDIDSAMPWRRSDRLGRIGSPGCIDIGLRGLDCSRSPGLAANARTARPVAVAAAPRGDRPPGPTARSGRTGAIRVVTAHRERTGDGIRSIGHSRAAAGGSRPPGPGPRAVARFRSACR